MFVVSKISQESQSFISKVKIDDVSMIGLAKAIIEKKPVPNTECDDITLFYIDNHSSSVRELVGKINELTILNTDYVLNACKTLWKVRALAACPSDKLPYVLPNVSNCTDVFGFGEVVSPEMYSIIQTSAFEIMDTYLGFRKLLEEITSVKKDD